VRIPAAVASLVLVTPIACSTPLPADRAAYVGEWHGNGVTLSISADGSLFFEKVAGGSREQIKGPIQSFEGDDISVGVLFIKSTIDVSKPPTQANGLWTMTLEGVEVTRAN
jgi:hypothetical protein